jgi:alpha-tubulin suppressor-like RCC1 family protein
VPDLSNVTAVAAGVNFGLALTRDGGALGWGSNTYGQALPPLSNKGSTVAIAVGTTSSFAIHADGTVTAWGAGNDQYFPTPPTGLNKVVTVAAGDNHVLALRTNGTVVAWGQNYAGQTSVPDDLENVIAVAAGGATSMALRRDGTVVVWGAGATDVLAVPAGLKGVKAISLNGFAVALKTNGTVVAWGEANAGRTVVPKKLSKVVAIAAGAFHGLALKSDGTVTGWGYDSDGEISKTAKLKGVTAIAAGAYFSIIMHAKDGTKSSSTREDVLSSASVTEPRSVGDAVMALAPATRATRILPDDTVANLDSVGIDATTTRLGSVLLVTQSILLQEKAPQVTLSVLLPDGWSLKASGNDRAATRPSPGDSALLEWTWAETPAGKLEITYVLNLPVDRLLPDHLDALIRINGTDRALMIKLH